MRNKILFFTILLSIFLLNTFSSTNEEKSIKITVNVNEEIAQNSQWVYWFSIIGNEYNVEDSLFLCKGRKEFTFEKVIGKDRGFYFTWLTFEKKGPIQSVILAIPGENIKLHISSNINNDASIQGSIFHNEDYRNKQLIRKMEDSLQLLTDSLFIVTNEIKRQKLEKNIKKIDHYIKSECYLDFLLKAESPITATLSYDALPLRYPNANLDSLKQTILLRFPNDKIVDQYFNYTGFPSATAESDKFYQKFLQLSENLNKPKEQTFRSENIDKIKSYQIGDKVDSILLKGLNGNIITINDIQTEYVFIDFWAAWCAPCRKEVPYLKKVAKKYPDVITIYAISLDNTEEEWKRAIDIDQSNIFTHVYGGMFTSPETSILQARFGVNAIPANLLLDKDRKIIAINLREEALMKKMDKLIRD